MKVLAFGASSSEQSINKALATYTANLIDGADVNVIDLNDFEMPLYSSDRESEFGIPKEAQLFLDEIAAADLIVVSFAEHNGSYTAAYKNLFDWASRISQKVYQDKPVLALSASPGKGGARNVLAAAEISMPFFGGKVLGSVSIPVYHEVMKGGELLDEGLKQSLQELVEKIALH